MARLIIQRGSVFMKVLNEYISIDSPEFPKIDLVFYNIENRYMLEPIYTGQKSFYRKAEVLETNIGKFLRSYDTIVAFIGNDNGFYRTWDDYSVTTMNHVNDFIHQNGISGGGKKWWVSQKCYNNSELADVFEKLSCLDRPSAPLMDFLSGLSC